MSLMETCFYSRLHGTSIQIIILLQKWFLHILMHLDAILFQISCFSSTAALHCIEGMLIMMMIYCPFADVTNGDVLLLETLQYIHSNYNSPSKIISPHFDASRCHSFLNFLLLVDNSIALKECWSYDDELSSCWCH